MKVKVNVHKSLNSAVKINLEDGFVTFDKGETVKDILEKLGFRKDQKFTILLNNKISKTTSPLKDGDILQIYPTLLGG